jgi:Fe-S cluster assembly iron-binding protein IscA
MDMIDITNQAALEMRRRFGQPGKTVTVRIGATSLDCKTPILAFKEDTEKPDDEILSIEGLTILLDRGLDAELGGVRVRYDESHWGGGNLSVSPLVNLVAGSCGDCRC